MGVCVCTFVIINGCVCVHVLCASVYLSNVRNIIHRGTALRPVHPPKLLELHKILVVLLANGCLGVQHARYPIVSQTWVIPLVMAGEPPSASAFLQGSKPGSIQRFH